jgi:large subunit ribosomal protein L2
MELKKNQKFSLNETRIKKLTKRISFTAGRNFGLISTPRRKSFIKKIYRFIDFERNLYANQSFSVRQVEYDSFRNNFIALICYPFGLLQYILLPNGISVGSELKNFGTNIGDSMKLKTLKGGSIVSNLGLYNFGCGKLIRSAGTSAILVRNYNNFSLVKLKSGELRLFNDNVMCIKGSNSNSEFFLRDLKKAGVKRKMYNFRPRNRALARNPVDHPMGGRTKGGVSKTPRGKNSKWASTINSNKISKYRVLTKRKGKFIKF